ncbi:hypothetical protein V6N13_062142 [Hibiscus sabdariffa]|uniref:Uncharacterized protein n=2 Tax=Hibiscus sabdariffa TaxID=183260 RepID=A0ABR2NAN2_9ROSI
MKHKTATSTYVQEIHLSAAETKQMKIWWKPGFIIIPHSHSESSNHNSPPSKNKCKVYPKTGILNTTKTIHFSSNRTGFFLGPVSKTTSKVNMSCSQTKQQTPCLLAGQCQLWLMVSVYRYSL